MPSDFKRPAVFSTCANEVLTEDLFKNICAWTTAQKQALEFDETRELARFHANKLQMDAAIWLFKFLLNKVTPKDTKSHTSLEHALKQVTYGHFYTAWYTLFYACYPRTAPMFDVSKSTFYQISLPPGHDLERLETEMNNRRFNWKLSHAGADVGEEECLKAVVFAIAGATGLDDESERLRIEVQNNPNMTAHAAIQFVKVLIQSKKASDTLTSEAKALQRLNGF